MKNIKFSLRRMLMYPKEFIILLAQSTIAFLLIYLSISQIFTISSFLMSTSTFKKHDEMITIVNNINYDILEQKTDFDNDSTGIVSAYMQIKSNTSFEVFEHFEVSTDLDRIREDNHFINGISFLLINGNDFDFNKYSVSSGSIFSSEQFDGNQEIIPILMGSELGKYYSLDEEFEQNGIKFKVIGFLNTGETSRGLVNGFESTIMDYKVLVPIDPYINKTIFENDSIPESVKSRFTESLISTMGVYDFTDINLAYNQIADTLDKTQLFDLEYRSTEEQIRKIYNQQLQSIIGYLVLSVTIVIFSGIGVVMGLNANIQKSKKYYAVHFLVGATHTDSYLTIIYQVLVTLSLSLCLSMIFMVLVMRTLNLLIILSLGLLVLVYCILISISPIRLLKRMNLDSVIGGER